MAYLVSLLPLLACPIGMGLMMVLMTRGNKGAPSAAAQPPRDQASAVRPDGAAAPHGVAASLARSPALLGALFRTCCLNGRVVAGLAVVGVGIWLLAPQVIGAALPLLLVAICPLSMLVGMRGMRGSPQATPEQPQRAGLALSAPCCAARTSPSTNELHSASSDRPHTAVIDEATSVARVAASVPVQERV